MKKWFRLLFMFTMLMLMAMFIFGTVEAFTDQQYFYGTFFAVAGFCAYIMFKNVLTKMLEEVTSK